MSASPGPPRSSATSCTSRPSPSDPRDGRTFALETATGRRVLTFPDGRYSPAVAIRGVLVLTGVHTLYALTPRG